MKISKADLGIIAQNFLRQIEQERISTIKQLEQKVGHTILINNQEGDFITVENRPSGLGTDAVTVSYIRPGAGISIEFKVNKMAGYVHTVVKTQENLPGYEIFWSDQFGNVMQWRRVSSLEVGEITDQLKELTKYTKK